MLVKGRVLFIFLVFILMITSGCGGGGGSSGASGGSSGGNTGTINLAWDSNTESDLEGYVVYYGTSSGFYENSIKVGMATQPQNNITTYTLTGLVKGNMYYIAITAYDLWGLESSFSNEVSGVAK
jgi:hypothetical protein